MYYISSHADYRRCRAVGVGATEREVEDTLAVQSRHVTAPTLVVIAGRGPEGLHPPPAELVPHARQVRMRQVDHHAAGRDAPAAVADLVRAFLTTDDAEAR